MKQQESLIAQSSVINYYTIMKINGYIKYQRKKTGNQSTSYLKFEIIYANEFKKFLKLLRIYQ